MDLLNENIYFPKPNKKDYDDYNYLMKTKEYYSNWNEHLNFVLHNDGYDINIIERIRKNNNNIKNYQRKLLDRERRLQMEHTERVAQFNLDHFH